MRRNEGESPVIGIGFEKAAGHGAGTMPELMYVKPMRGTDPHSHDMSPDLEQDYMTRIATGDKAAFSHMVNAHMTDIYRFAYSILGDPSRAEDITQEACLKLWTRAGQWNPSGKVRSWLFRITHNLCMDDLRSRKPTLPIDKFTFILSDPQPDQAKVYASNQVSKVVHDALLSLPERQRTALMLVHYSGYTNIESAQIMDLSVDAIESLLARGRRKMKELLSGSKESLLEG